MQKIYFGEKALILLSGLEVKDYVSDENVLTFDYTENGLKSAIAALDNLGLYRTILIHHDENEVLHALKMHFTIIQAGGGLVQTNAGEILLIFRRGKWDLPKGKLDHGEDLEQCAVREVIEETGLEAPRLGSRICVTYHTYAEKGKSILKESHWYNMTVPEKQTLEPQTEEDIEICEWVLWKDIDRYKQNMHPSVKDVLEKGLQQVKHLPE
jgi:8-oxo-dGTP pyrophosphatase MutT (NUDIX family)